MELEFRLIYRGSLPAQGKGGSRVKEKHAIRRQLHSQLRELWYGHQLLKRYTNCEYFDAAAGGDKKTTGLDLMSRKFAKGAYHFLPLVGGEFGIACSLGEI
jgi:hypothetical protein